MQATFDIKFLSNEDFDNMPILDRLGEDVSDSFGIYNPYTGQIRIRDTGFWETNQYLLEHELEHVVEEHATDMGPNGLRHKKGKKFFKEIFAPLFLPAIAPLINGTGAKGYGEMLKGAGTGFFTGGPIGAVVGGTLGSVNSAKSGYEQRREANQFGEQSSGPQISIGGFGNYGNENSNTPNFATSQSPFSEQQSSQGGFNQGLNSQSVNPLTDTSNPYARYGQQQGRTINF